MKALTLGRRLACLSFIFGLPAMLSAGFFSTTWGDVVVVTDMTTEGRKITPPSRSNPVYYKGSSLGCKFGSIPGDALPDVKEMNQFVAKILAKQGYLGARPGLHEPNLFLVIQWGYLRPGSGDLLWFLGYDASQDIGASHHPNMLGAEVFRRGMRSRTIETVLETASEPIYGIIVTAFDFQTAHTNKPVIYWQTRIALPARGKSMDQALPAMMVAAGSTIGRETKAPVLSDADSARSGDVQFGEIEVLDVIEDAELPEMPKAPVSK